MDYQENSQILLGLFHSLGIIKDSKAALLLVRLFLSNSGLETAVLQHPVIRPHLFKRYWDS